MSEPRHLGMLRITGELVQEMFLTTSLPDRWFQVQRGIPADAKFVRSAIDTSYGRSDLVLVYEHPSFPKVWPGEPLTTIDSPMLASVHASPDELRWLWDELNAGRGPQARGIGYAQPLSLNLDDATKTGMREKLAAAEPTRDADTPTVVGG